MDGGRPGWSSSFTKSTKLDRRRFRSVVGRRGSTGVCRSPAPSSLKPLSIATPNPWGSRARQGGWVSEEAIAAQRWLSTRVAAAVESLSTTELIAKSVGVARRRVSFWVRVRDEIFAPFKIGQHHFWPFDHLDSTLGSGTRFPQNRRGWLCSVQPTASYGGLCASISVRWRWSAGGP